MKKVYTAPKAEKVAFETKDIITASRMLTLRDVNDSTTYKISEIDWENFTNSAS